MSVKFGWIISGRDKMTPTQKSQLALISVPAWTTEIKLHINAGWLNRNGGEVVDHKFNLPIVLPPELDSLDTVMFQDGGGRGPKIHSSFIPGQNRKVLATVHACTATSILIPGSRLWRSTAVTLGSQLADRITVLPNMEGIVAYFEKVVIPSVVGIDTNEPIENSNDVVEVPLSVWTSEGVDTAKNNIRVQLPAGDQSHCDKLRPEQTSHAQDIFKE
ncbi:MAG: hypothetical protein GY789_18525 [Hyphomicrobiales bacterium]|nr:hypothetical protein [Hyphomicrobiales bacterium]MCP5000245.1 hypothetical protein [Hyphomicrobiales bacterium]